MILHLILNTHIPLIEVVALIGSIKELAASSLHCTNGIIVVRIHRSRHVAFFIDVVAKRRCHLLLAVVLVEVLRQFGLCERWLLLMNIVMELIDLLIRLILVHNIYFWSLKKSLFTL